MSDAEAIARSMSARQIAALAWLPASGEQSRTRSPWQHTGSLGWLCRRGCAVKIEVGRVGFYADCRWALTPLGLAVRAVLLAKAAPPTDKPPG